MGCSEATDSCAKYDGTGAEGGVVTTTKGGDTTQMGMSETIFAGLLGWNIEGWERESAMYLGTISGCSDLIAEKSDLIKNNIVILNGCSSVTMWRVRAPASIR